MNKQWVLWAMLVTLVAAPVWAENNVKIGYVDLQRALNESDAGKRARDDFKVQVDKAQNALKKQKDELESLREQLEKKAAVMKEEERRTIEKDLARKGRDFERAYKDSQAELQAKDNELTAVILRELQQVIRDYGDKQGFTLILENSSQAVLYGAKDADLTEQIIEIYNSQGGAKGKAKAKEKE
ncbi:MAG: OmpH family outer membrane protein [Deltaproteobacteria bacterium]|nr:OmpH family outer membrane protein [Deltaproteobacteria bacterium]